MHSFAEYIKQALQTPTGKAKQHKPQNAQCPSNGWGRLMLLVRGGMNAAPALVLLLPLAPRSATRLRSARINPTREQLCRARRRTPFRPGGPRPSLAWLPQYRRCSNKIFDSPLFDDRPRRRRRRFEPMVAAFSRASNASIACASSARSRTWLAQIRLGTQVPPRCWMSSSFFFWLPCLTDSHWHGARGTSLKVPPVELSRDVNASYCC